MSLVQADGMPPVHFPQGDKFQFDAEVSHIFEDMAKRSIPMYEEAHRLHASLLAPILDRGDKVTVYDIGASRGHFFKEICNQLQIDVKEGDSRFNFVAVDQSMHMLDRLKEEMPWVQTVESDALQLVDLQEPADIICLFYLLQFIHEAGDKLALLQWANRNIREGGIVLLGQKERVSPTYCAMFDDEYYQFRMRNGYSLAEIQAKTKALKNSMWPSTPAWLEDMCYRAGFKDYVVTSKWLQFSTSMCTK